MDGENKGKPYEQMGWFGGIPNHYFWFNTHMTSILGTLPKSFILFYSSIQTFTIVTHHWDFFSRNLGPWALNGQIGRSPSWKSNLFQFGNFPKVCLTRIRLFLISFWPVSYDAIVLQLLPGYYSFCICRFGKLCWFFREKHLPFCDENFSFEVWP